MVMNVSVFYKDIILIQWSDFDLRLKQKVLRKISLFCLASNKFSFWKKCTENEEFIWQNGRRSNNASLNINFHFEKHSFLTMVNKNDSYVSTILPVSYLGFEWLHYINVYTINIYWFGKFISDPVYQPL